MSESILRQHSLPVLYTRGTHYEVGLDMGRTFAGMIKSFLETHKGLAELLLKAYETEAGQKLYDEALQSVKESFPQYIRELEGIAKGAGVEFHMLFLLHLGDLLPNYIAMASPEELKDLSMREPLGTGSFNIVINNYYNCFVAHTQDAPKDRTNNAYIVVAHIINEEPAGKHGVVEEKFTSLCYAGHLPGFAFSSNQHGLIFTVNKLTPGTVGIGRTPAHFLARALLSAENMEQVELILTDDGVGAADGFSLVVASHKTHVKKVFMVEVAPAIVGETQSLLKIEELELGSCACHGNSYESLEVDETRTIFRDLSMRRLEIMKNYEPLKSKQHLLDALNDRDIFLGEKYPAPTLLVAVFDLTARSLVVYLNQPQDSEPILEMPLTFSCFN